MSSLYDVPAQPAWLRGLQIAGLIAQLIAFALLFCHMSFGMWPESAWLAPTVLALQAVFLVGQVAVFRWNRSLKQT